MEDFFGIEEFAEKVGYSPRRIRQLCIEGKINAQKLGEKTRKWLIPVSEIGRFKESSQQRILKGKENSTQIEGHQRDMLEIAQAMLANGLEHVTCRHIKELGPNAKIYEIPNVGSFVDSGLSSILCDNFVKLHYNPSLINYFCEHMEKGYPGVARGSFRQALDQNPYELIETLRLIIASRKIKGTCPVCEEWQ